MPVFLNKKLVKTNRCNKMIFFLSEKEEEEEEKRDGAIGGRRFHLFTVRYICCRETSS